MRYFFSLLFLQCSFAIYGQEIRTLNPSIGQILDFGPSVQKQWAVRDEVLRSLDSRERSWDELTEGERKLVQKYGEVYESMWDIIGGGCSWYCGGGPKEVTASSYLKSQGDNDYTPQNAHDLNYKNAWVEGVKGHGVGEYLEYHFDPVSPRINEIIIVNGYVKSESAWKNNNRVKKLKIYIDQEPFVILNLQDVRAQQSFKVDPIGYSDRKDHKALMQKAPWTIKFEILEVYPGLKYDDTVITEIFFDGMDVHCLAKGTEITMSDFSTKKIELLEVGDSVLSYNFKTKTYESSLILELANPIHDNLIELHFENGNKIISTTDHPFYNGKNWCSYHPEKTMHCYDFEKVLQLEDGARLQSESGYLEIKSISILHWAQETYTIVRLDKNNSFIANGVLVGTEQIRKALYTKTTTSLN